MSNLDHIYRAYQQRAALISGEDPDGNTIPGHPVSVAPIGETTDAEAAGDGTLIAITKRIRTLLGSIITLLAGGLPASLGQKTKTASLAVTLATDEPAALALGSTTDAEAAAGNGSIIALLKRLRTLLNGGLPAALGAGSGLKVDGSGVALPVSGAFYPATQPISVVDGGDVAEGTTTDAAVITDVAGTLSGKLRGLIKWAFERMPVALGQGTMAESLPVVLPSNQTNIPVSQGTHDDLQANVNIQVGDTDVAAGNPVPDDVQVISEVAWTTLINEIRLDDDPTFYYSAALDIDGWSAVWILIDIDSTLAPTDIRILAQFSDDGGTTWWDFVEGLWASLFWEDADTAAGIKRAFLLPCGGIDDIRVGAIATGTNATNFFDVTVKARAFRGNFGLAHA